MKYGLNCNGEIEIRTEIPQKPKYKSEEIWILEANGINSKLKYGKAHNSILSGRFGDPYEDREPGELAVYVPDRH